MIIENDLQEFINIWLKYYNYIPAEPLVFDIYHNILNKIKNGEIDFYEEKENFQQLLEDIVCAIYNKKHYDEDKKYNDKELDCCSRIKKYLEIETV